MAHVITKNGDVMNIVYTSGRFEEYSRNVVTGHSISLLKDDICVETTILCSDLKQYVHADFDTIAGVDITTNQILFDELEKLL